MSQAHSFVSARHSRTDRQRRGVRQREHVGQEVVCQGPETKVCGDAYRRGRTAIVSTRCARRSNCANACVRTFVCLHSDGRCSGTHAVSLRCA
eukprot:2077968-Rhodomonas_salina.1